jgi:hypothetical protein
MNAEDYPTNLLDALNKDWSVRSFSEIYTDSRGNKMMYVEHYGVEHPFAIPVPKWLETLLNEERGRERHRIQMGLKQLIGIL